MGRRVAFLAVALSGTAVAIGKAVVVLRRKRRNALEKTPKGTVGEPVTLHSVEELESLRTRLVSLPVQQLATLSNLVRLDIEGCNLAQLPAEISLLKNLQVLLAPRNKLTHVPPEIGRLSHSLVQLDLGSNKLTEVPGELFQLTGLHTLNLMCNELAALPAGLGDLRKLRLLGLKSNKLTSLPASISQLTNLVELFLTNNRLTDLPDGMSQCTSLVKLQASFNSFTSLPACLLRLPLLELLRVAVCDIRALPAHMLEEGVMPRLAWASMAGNPVCPDPPAPAPGLPEVEVDDLDLGMKLADGASGEVFRAVWRGDLVAVKFFRGDVSPDGRAEDEVALAIALQHPHLTQVLAKVKYPPGLVLRLASGNPLAHKPTSKHLLRCKWGDDVRFAPHRALLLAVAVADALAYLHAAGICHGDVYAHNVLMDEDENVTLCDFGASFSYDAWMQPYWQAMEVRAYGLLLRDVAARCEEAEEAGGAIVARVVGALQQIADRCADMPPAQRPLFAAVRNELLALRKSLFSY
ncbi:hypothetical protein VOLCADRAFT_86211 [Volvox carteri f. nagariensis]|uniref:Protein kinase domain-containing protein n=1 Tax=Volvox carteri f. nagariensis TaxID=3068 RepID=D8TI68_VOLCA|nr:uncharacterized protein VOLCADRAFT_86211 [Volvox carteri f. nagariensis]EFJ52843.1 hypothetical protein VOLCADRAFT_86211 [Volvox carteri f. nagariensis]|eukprot:XP_002945848.1 hypothetical protein VOLCADRAFT_86211 [Volvox carteri f. nagariensis]